MNQSRTFSENRVVAITASFYSLEFSCEVVVARAQQIDDSLVAVGCDANILGCLQELYDDTRSRRCLPASGRSLNAENRILHIGHNSHRRSTNVFVWFGQRVCRLFPG